MTLLKDRKSIQLDQDQTVKGLREIWLKKKNIIKMYFLFLKNKLNIIKIIT